MPIVKTVQGKHNYVFKYGNGPKDKKSLFQTVGKLACSTDVNFNWRNAAVICWQAHLGGQAVLAGQEKKKSVL